MAEALDQDSGTHNRKSWWLFWLLLIGGVAALYFRYPEMFNLTQEPAAPLKQIAGQPPAPKNEIAITPPSFDVAYAQPTGEVVIAGRGEPDWVIRLHSNGTRLGETKADQNGEWVYTPDKALPPGEHSLSLVETDPDGKRTVAGKSSIVLSVTQQREAAAQKREAAAIGGGTSAALTQNSKQPGQPGTITTESTQANANRKDCDVAIVKGGDTLWGMAERCYGVGTQYSKIYNSNRPLIRDPNLIYPDQKFVLPR